MDETVYCECNWYFAHKDDSLTVTAKRTASDKVELTIKEMSLTLSGTERQIKEFAESVMYAVMRLPDKANPYASDKIKGDAFEALRRAE